MSRATHLGCVQHCLHQHVHAALGKAKPLLTCSPKSIIIPVNPLHLQAWVKRISKVILPCLEAHFGDLVTFQPHGHFQLGVTSRCYPPCRLLQHEGKLPEHTGHCAQPGSYLCSRWAGLLMSNSMCATHTTLLTPQSVLESSHSCGCIVLFYSQVFLCR